MNRVRNFKTQLLWPAVLAAALVLFASCSPINEAQLRPFESTRVARLAATADALAPAETVAAETVTPEPVAEATSPAETPQAVTPAPGDEESATATIGVRVLRVREAPSTNAEVIGVVYADQVYPIIGRSSNGLWMQLGEIPGLPGESGWVISELALVLGDFSMIPVVQVEDLDAADPSRLTEEGPAPSAALPTVTPQPIVTLAAVVTVEVTPIGPSAPASGATPIGVTTDGANGSDGSNGADGSDGASASTPLTATQPITAAAEVTEAVAVETPAEAPAELVIVTRGAAALPAGVEPPPAGFALVVTDGIRLRVRDLPNTESLIVGYAYPGETFRVLQQSEDGAWTQINGSADAKENPTGGWVASEYLYFGQ